MKIYARMIDQSVYEKRIKDVEETNNAIEVIEEDWVSTEDDLPQKDPKYKNLSIEVEVKIKKSGNKTTAFYDDKNNKWFSTKTMKVIEVDKWRTATTLNNRQE